jgi:hypothetical protein|tara:strand:+ start:121 stop:585 length:465 start_codon:yes stop_codon:yes gene_type:complete
MEGLAVLQQAHDAGLAVWVDGDDLQVEGRSTLEALAALERLREHKAEVIQCLNQKNYRKKYPDEPLGDQELEEIAQRVETEGFVLCWSEAVEDFVAFYSGEKNRQSVPPGFVPYSLEELSKLFAEGEEPLSPNGLRLVHQAKKMGGRVIDATDR